VESITRRLAAVAFADVADWSRLVEANELAALRNWNALRTGLLEPQITAHGGRLVDIAGDAVFAEFPSAIDAVQWAIEVQRQRPRHVPSVAPAEGTLWLRIGINVCDLLVHEGRLTGDGVNIASRIHNVAAPGEIVVTEAVREHVRKRADLGFVDLGEHTLKNISRPVRIYRLETLGPAAWPTPTPAPVPADADADADPGALLALELTTAQNRAAPAGGRPPGGHALVARLEREVLPGSGGHVVGRHENHWLIAFPGALPAMKAAFEIHRLSRSAGAGARRTDLPRMGLQMGVASQPHEADPVSAVGLAERLIAIGGPGDIVVTSAVRDKLTSSLDADIEDLGECDLGRANPAVRAYRLDPPGPRPGSDRADELDDLRPTLAVIPFREHGEGYAPLGEIVAEEVIAALSRSHELSVVSRLSTTAFRHRDASLADVRAYLRAGYVLSGAYRVAAGAIILAAELADAKTGRVVWAGDLRGKVTGVIEGNDALIDRLVAEASGAVMARELERSRSQSLHSLDTCTLLVGAITLMHRLSRHDFDRAHEMLRVVAQRAPRHAVPLAWLAKWHVLRVWQSWSDDPAADTRLALDCGKRALDNDSQCSLALVIDGFVHTNLLKALDVARARYELALQVNPNDSLAWLLSGMLHAFKGEGAQAVKSTQRALRLSPLDPHRYFYDSLAGGAALAAGHYERAVELTQRSLRANRMHASTFRMLAIAQWQLGREAEARATVAELMRIEPNLTVTGWLERSPSAGYPIGTLCADTLRQAGVPA
jgi:adenylate cyclase